MADLRRLGLEFTESMSDWIGIGVEEYIEGRIAGQRENTPIQFSVKITIDDLDHFINLSDHDALLTGSVSFEPLGNKIPHTQTPKKGLLITYSLMISVR